MNRKRPDIRYCPSSRVRRQSIVQITLKEQTPKLEAKQYLTYVEMPENWAEVSDTQKE